MTVFHFLAAAAVLVLALSCAILPFVAVWDRRLAIARRRSLYDKSAGQTESLTAVLCTLFACALGADLLFAGCIDKLMTGAWRILWEGMVMISAFAALSSILVLYSKQGLRNAFSVLSGLASAASASLCVLLVWAFLFGAMSNASAEAAAHDFVVALESMKSADFVIFLLFCISLAFAAAYGLALCWHILLRNRDDYGRDYYSFTLGMRSRQASYGGLMMVMTAALQYSMYPELAKDWALARLPLAGDYAELALTFGLLSIPAAFGLWYSMSRSALPMQKRSYAFLAMFLIVAGAYCALVRI